MLQCAAIYPGMWNVAVTHRITINLEETEYEKLSALSSKNRVSLAWLGRQAIIDLLDNHDNGQLALPIVMREENKDRI